VRTPTYLLAALLVTVAIGFAAARARRGPRVQPPPPGASAVPPAQAALMQRVFEAECEACHAAGDGPHDLAAVAERTALLAAEPSGRGSLIDLLLTGRSTRTPPPRRKHPAFAGLTDEELAQTLNFLVLSSPQRSMAKPIAADEVAARR
jgi:cytochrome c5